jgi:hypothetical protein
VSAFHDRSLKSPINKAWWYGNELNFLVISARLATILATTPYKTSVPWNSGHSTPPRSRNLASICRQGGLQSQGRLASKSVCGRTSIEQERVPGRRRKKVVLGWPGDSLHSGRSKRPTHHIPAGKSNGLQPWLKCNRPSHVDSECIARARKTSRPPTWGLQACKDSRRGHMGR